MTVEYARQLGPAQIDIAYERFGDAHHPPVLLIMGIGTQMIGWSDGFCTALAAHGLHVIRFDNRDVGLSTHLHQAPVPNLLAAFAGDSSTASYTLSDMATDTVNLLTALGIESAHVVGASMGGFIAQHVALEHRSRVRSLTSIMSSTGSRSVGHMSVAARSMFSLPPVTSREEMMDRAVNVFGSLASAAYPIDVEEVRARAALSYDRAYDPLGVARQGVAVFASGDRTERLRLLDVPALVLHGTADKVVDQTGAQATAAAIPGARLVLLEDMAHDLPRALWPAITAEIAALVQRAERT